MMSGWAGGSMPRKAVAGANPLTSTSPPPLHDALLQPPSAICDAAAGSAEERGNVTIILALYLIFFYNEEMKGFSGEEDG